MIVAWSRSIRSQKQNPWVNTLISSWQTSALSVLRASEQKSRRSLHAARPQAALNNAMDLIQIYHCFCDRTRLRILHLLKQSPLCVCHLQQILGEPQVKISKHLRYLRQRRIVTATRDRNWMIYSLTKKRPQELQANLKCLQDCVQSDRTFARDLRKLAQLLKKCCEPEALSAANRS
jgi:ArsR family transcriptional regulator